MGGTVKTRGLHAVLSTALKRKRIKFLTETIASRRFSLRGRVHLQRSGLSSAQRRVFLAQRRVYTYRTRRGLKRRVRRVRPKTRFRYFGIFGKRRRRAERRDRLQLMRLATASRRRAALRYRARLAQAAAVASVFRARCASIGASTYLSSALRAAAAVRRVRLRRTTAVYREHRTN